MHRNQSYGSEVSSAIATVSRALDLGATSVAPTVTQLNTTPTQTLLEEAVLEKKLWEAYLARRNKASKLQPKWFSYLKAKSDVKKDYKEAELDLTLPFPKLYQLTSTYVENVIIKRLSDAETSNASLVVSDPELSEDTILVVEEIEVLEEQVSEDIVPEPENTEDTHLEEELPTDNVEEESLVDAESVSEETVDNSSLRKEKKRNSIPSWDEITQSVEGRDSVIDNSLPHSDDDASNSESVVVSVEETSVEEDSVEETSVEEDAVEEDAVEEDSVEEDSVEEDSVEDTSVEEDSVEDTSVEEDSVEEDSVEDTSVEEDSVDEDPFFAGLVEPPADGFAYDDQIVEESVDDEDIWTAEDIPESIIGSTGTQIVVDKLVVQNQVTEQANITGASTAMPTVTGAPAPAQQPYAGQPAQVMPTPPVAPAYPQRPSTVLPVFQPSQQASAPAAPPLPVAPVQPVAPEEKPAAAEDAVSAEASVEPTTQEYQAATQEASPSVQEKTQIHADMEVLADSVNITNKGGINPLANFDPSRYLNLARAIEEETLENSFAQEDETVSEEPEVEESQDSSNPYLLNDPVDGEPQNDSVKVNQMLKELRQLRGGLGGLL